MSNGTTSRFPSPSNGGWAGALKTVLQSQVGGWVIACVVFGFIAHWVVQDREAVYADLANLRERAMPVLYENQKIARENQAMLEQILKHLKER